MKKKLLIFGMAAIGLGIAGYLVVVAWQVDRQEKARHHNNQAVALMDPDTANNADYKGAASEFETALRYWPDYGLARGNL